jgi:hypothetical protein
MNVFLAHMESLTKAVAVSGMTSLDPPRSAVTAAVVRTCTFTDL